MEYCNGGSVDVTTLGGKELVTAGLGGGFDGLGGGVECTMIGTGVLWMVGFGVVNRGIEDVVTCFGSWLTITLGELLCLIGLGFLTGTIVE